MSTDSDSDTEFGKGTPSKKRKLYRYNQKYCNTWEQAKRFQGWLKRSDKGDEYFHCNACNCDLK